MTLNTLSLPIDIPWKRICVSSDMIDGVLCDRTYSPRWRSSLAVFRYDPPEDDQIHEDALVSYLKVSCSITGYQAGREIALYDRGPWTKRNIEDEYRSMSKYYPCLGAILEVAVGKADDPFGVVSQGLRREGDDVVAFHHELPYFADFEPKKRELFEAVTETKERLSRSLEAANVRKGMTTTPMRMK